MADKNAVLAEILDEYISDQQYGVNETLVTVKNNHAYVPMEEAAVDESLRVIRYRIRHARKSPHLTTLSTASSFAVLLEGWRSEHGRGRRRRDFSRYSIRSLPLWRDLSPDMKARYYQRTLDREQKSIPFSLNLSPELLDRAAESKVGLTSYLHRHLSRYLNREFGHKVEYWFILERTSRGRIHLHGSIGVDEGEKKRLSDCLRKASLITNKKFQNRIVKLKSFSDYPEGGHGWTRYCCKQARKASKELDTSAVSVTNSLRRGARELYEAERETLISLLGLA